MNGLMFVNSKLCIILNKVEFSPKFQVSHAQWINEYGDDKTSIEGIVKIANWKYLLIRILCAYGPQNMKTKW